MAPPDKRRAIRDLQRVFQEVWEKAWLEGRRDASGPRGPGSRRLRAAVRGVQKTAPVFPWQGRTLTKCGSWITIAAKRQGHAARDRIPSHPGEVLQEQFLEPLGPTQVALSEHLGAPVQRINEIVLGKRGVPRTKPGFTPCHFRSVGRLWPPWVGPRFVGSARKRGGY